MTYELTAQDIKALRNADTICADSYERDGARTVGLRAILRAENSSTGFEQVHFVPADEIWECYGEAKDTGFAHLSSAKFNPHVQTFLAASPRRGRSAAPLA